MQLGKFFHKYAGSVLLVVILVGASMVGAVIRFGADNGGWRYTGMMYNTDYIVTTNNTYYSFTQTGIEAAISNTPFVDVVQLPRGNVTFITDVIIHNCTVKGMGSGEGFEEKRGKMMTNISLENGASIIVRDGGALQDVCVYQTDAYDVPAVYIIGDGNKRHGQQNILNNVRVVSPQAAVGTGVNISCVDQGSNAAVPFCTFNNVAVEGFYYGMYLYSSETSGNGWINGNIFNNLVFYKNTYPLTLHGVGTAECSGNIFNGLQIQPDNSDGTVRGIRLIDNSDENIFTGVMMWDWTGDTEYAIVCNGSYNYFNGRWYGQNNIDDNGGNNVFIEMDSVLTSDYYILDANINATGPIWQPIYGCDDNLSMFLSFSEKTGSYCNDRSPLRNDGVLTGCLWSHGLVGNALYFDGADDGVTIADDNSLTFPGNFTIMFWFKIDSSDATQDYMIQKWEASKHEYLISVQNAKITTQVRVGGVEYTETSGTLDTDTWYFYVCRYDGSDLVIYMSDDENRDSYDAGSNRGDIGLKLSDSATGLSGGMTNYATNVYLGSYMTTNNYFNGHLDEIKFFNRSLGMDEIRTSYLSGFQSNGYIQSNNFTVFDSNWEPWLKVPTTNCSTVWEVGQMWYDVTNHKLMVYEGAGVWKSTTLT